MTQVQSKKQIASNVYAALVASGQVITRKAAIAELCDKAGLSPAGASTYFHNFKTGLWVIAAPTLVEEVLLPESDDGVSLVEEVLLPVADEVVEEIAEVTLPDNYTELTKAQLVELFNSKSIKQVVNFRDHATAVRRVTELFTAE